MAVSAYPINLKRDKYKNEIDPSMTLDERYAELGFTWVLGTARGAMLDNGIQSISFTTPAATVARCFLNHLKVMLYGGLVDLTVIEDPTLSDPGLGDPEVFLNLNRRIGDAGCPLLTPFFARTSTDGTVLLSEFIGGAATPADHDPSDTEVAAWMELKPSTAYSIQIEAEGAVTWAQLQVRVTCLAVQS